MKSFHKRLFLVVIVILPMWWLLFIEDGRSRSDRVVLWLAGGDEIDINFRVLDSRFSQQDWKQVYPDINWQCSDQQSAFGDQFCFSELAAYNGIPSSYITVFFRQQHVSALKLVYRNQYHQKLGLDLQQQLGAPLEKNHDSADNDMLQWPTENGMVMIKKEITPQEEASLIWLAR